MKKRYVLLSVVSALFIWIFSSGHHSAPESVYPIIEDVLDKEIENLHIGDTASVSCNGFDIWYEVIGDLNQPTMMLFCGLGTSATIWPNYLIDSLRKEGFTIIRFDHREIGHSSWDKDWGFFNAYTLDDMASDANCLSNHLGLESLHIVGISMGGMVAQEFAIDYPEKVKSLTIINSTAHLFSKELTTFSPYIAKGIGRFALTKGWDNKHLDKRIDAQLSLFTLLKRGDEMPEQTVEWVSKTLKFDHETGRIRNPKVKYHQIVAMWKSGSREAALAKLEIPTLIFHGVRDPLIEFEHGERLFEIMPNAQFYPIEQMTHIPTKEEFTFMGDRISCFVEGLYSLSNQ